MKYYKLKALSVGAKGNRVLMKEDNKTYPENTWPEKIADELVELGFLIKVKEDPIKAEPESKSEPEEAGGGESENEKKALLKEAKKLAKEKGIKPPHRLMGIKKLKIFIEENTVDHTKEDKPEVPKAKPEETDKEPSILDSMQEAGGEENEEKPTPPPSQLISEDGASEDLPTFDTEKTFINDNK